MTAKVKILVQVGRPLLAILDDVNIQSHWEFAGKIKPALPTVAVG